MSDLRTAAQQALEALYEADTFHRNLPDQRVRRLAAMAALRSALAQQDEPEGSVCARCGALAFDPLVPQQDEPVEPVATLIAQRDALLEVLKYLDKEFRRHGRQHWPEAVRVGAAIRVRTP